MHLTTLWFGLIVVLWVGYFVLEGFDFGVGMLLPLVGRTENDRRVMLRSLGPIWDGNEVWLLVAGGATFAAFPEWYASMFSGFYLALLLILVGLILRGVAIEYRNKRDEDEWHRRWDVVICVSSAVPALLWGVAFSNVVRGVPLNAHHIFTGNLLTLLNPYALLGGLVTLSLFALHGAIFLGLKTAGRVRVQAREFAVRFGIVAVALAAIYLLITQVEYGRGSADAVAAVAAVALIAGLLMAGVGREGWAFALTAFTLGAAVVTLFLDLWPNVLPSSTSAAFDLTVTNASSSSYTLGVMTWVALIMTPVVLAYQAWSYWIFRKRVTGDDFTVDLRDAVPTPRDSPTSAPHLPSTS